MPPAPPTDPYVKYSLIRFVSTRRKASDPGRSQPRRMTRCCPQLCSAICASRVDTVGALKVAPVFPSPRGHARLRLPAASRPVSWVPWASVPHASGSVTLRPRCLRYYASLRLPSSVPAGSLLAPDRYLGLTVSVKRDAGRRKPWISGGAARSEAHRPDNRAPPDSMRITAAGTGFPDWTGAVSNNWAAVASPPYSSLRAIVGVRRSNILED